MPSSRRWTRPSPWARSREAKAALDLVLTNRGKALMDEANVYITGITQAADNRLSTLVAEQAANAGWQRIVAVTGGLAAIAAAAAALITILRYARELSGARDALAAANAGLESKVAARTADLASSTEAMRAARDRAELLMHEVNHRVANSLAMVSSLVGLQANAIGDDATKAVLAETQARIHAVSLVHRQLYHSADVAQVALDEYLRSVLDQFQASMGEGARIALQLPAGSDLAQDRRQHQPGRHCCRMGDERRQIRLSERGGRGAGHPGGTCRRQGAAQRRG